MCIKQNDELLLKVDQQTKKIDVQSEKLDMLARILYRETDNKVVDVTENKKKQELVILQNKKNPNQCEVLRGQVKHNAVVKFFLNISVILVFINEKWIIFTSHYYTKIINIISTNT